MANWTEKAADELLAGGKDAIKRTRWVFLAMNVATHVIGRSAEAGRTRSILDTSLLTSLGNFRLPSPGRLHSIMSAEVGRSREQETVGLSGWMGAIRIVHTLGFRMRRCLRMRRSCHCLQEL